MHSSVESSRSLFNSIGAHYDETDNDIDSEGISTLTTGYRKEKEGREGKGKKRKQNNEPSQTTQTQAYWQSIHVLDKIQFSSCSIQPLD